MWGMQASRRISSRLSNWKGAMKATKSALLSCGVLAVLFCTSVASAQQKTRSALRQPSTVAANDTVLEGTVVSFTANSTVPPLGAHVVIETSSGTVDVHLGKASLLQQANISLAAGDSIRVSGSSVPFGDGAVFAARILQKGTLSVTLRNQRGIPVGSRRAGTLDPQAREGAR
jgi:hypothetical protein